MCKKEIETINYEEMIGSELPERITDPYPYVVLGDLGEVTKRLNIQVSGEAMLNYQKKLFDILYEASPEGTTYIPTTTEPIIRKVEEKIISEILDGKKNLGIVQLDRYIGEGISDERFFRLNVSRGVDGGLVSRPGCSIGPEEQVVNLLQWAVEGNYEKILMVDDVLAFGDTLVPLIESIRELLPSTEIEILVGIASSGGSWNGIERVKEATGVNVKAVTIVNASEETEWTSGMALPTARDFTFLGGKIMNSGERQMNFPYFLPFSVPVVSFMPKEARFDVSLKLMDLSIEMVNAIDITASRQITVGDLMKAGFGVPTSKMKCLADDMVIPNEETKLIDYLEYYKYLMEQKQSEIKTEAGVMV